jgi:CubicO group peptidase (beta-lactamase class C family)
VQSLEAAIAAAAVTGASFAYWDGAHLETAVAGVRNSVTGDPVTPDTLMHIGSISKVLNTVLVMQLVDEGRIALEDPVLEHLPELRLRDRDALERITCAMLLNHTSGIDGDMLPDHGPDKERIVDAIARCEALGQLHPPGEGASYCNMGTVIAGYLAQQLRGESWYRLIKKRLYAPLGMEHALADLTDLPRFRHSIGDLEDPVTQRLVQTTRPFLPLSFAPAGTTLMTSAADLVTFARIFLNGGVGPNGTRILSAASVARMTERTAAFVAPAGWHLGLGWMLLKGGLLHHSGGGPGVSSVLYAHPESGRAFALLTNCNRHDALRPSIIDPILQSWTGTREPVAKRRSGSDSFNPVPYEGVYESGLYRAEVFVRDGGLAVRMTPKTYSYDTEGHIPPGRLHPLGDHAFEGEAVLPGCPTMEIRFARPDGAGRMQHFAFLARLLVRTRAHV